MSRVIVMLIRAAVWLSLAIIVLFIVVVGAYVLLGFGRTGH